MQVSCLPAVNRQMAVSYLCRDRTPPEKDAHNYARLVIPRPYPNSHQQKLRLYAIS